MRNRTLVAFVALAAITGAASPSSAAVTGSMVTFNGVTQAIGLTADLITLFGLTNNQAPSNTLTIDARGSDRNFTLALLGGQLDDTTELKFSGVTMGDITTAGGGSGTANFWKWDLIFNSSSIFDSLVLNDSLTVSGSITHIFGPHPGDEANGTPLTFSTFVDADNAVNHRVSNTDPSVPKKKDHPAKHFDILKDATLSGTTDTTFLTFDYFRSFQFEARATHVPEPATWTLLILGFGLTGVAARRRRAPA